MRKMPLRMLTIRVPEEAAAAFDAVAAFRGETRNRAVAAAMKALVEATFRGEIRNGEDILVQKMPREIRLSDVCRAFGIEFPGGKGGR